MGKAFSTSLLFALFGVVACTSNANTVKFERETTGTDASLDRRGFSYEISDRKLASVDGFPSPSDSQYAYSLNREALLCAKDRGLANYYNRSDEVNLADTLRSVGGAVIEHQWINVARPVASGNPKDGTDKVEWLAPVKQYYPVYTVQLIGNDSDDLSDMTQVAGAAHVTGHYVFSGKSAASFFHKIWKLNSSSTDRPIFSPDHFGGQTQGSTAEGVLFPSTNFGSPTYEPNTTTFWWVNGTNGGYPYGADINNAVTGLNSWTYASGTGVSVGLIDYAFQGPSESSIPWYICNNTPVRWNYATGNSTGFAGDSVNTFQQHAYHGRECASLIFAPNGDQAGTCGTAPFSNPYLFKIDGYESTFTQAFNQAVGWSCKVISMSLITSPMSTFNSAVQFASSTYGTILVACSGNDGDGTYYPESYGNVLSVSALDQNEHKALMPTGTYANSIGVKLWAPGLAIATATMPSNERYPSPQSQSAPDPRQFHLGDGTSFATPIVAGIVADLVQKGYVSNYSTALSRLQSRGIYNYNVSGYQLDAVHALQP